MSIDYITTSTDENQPDFQPTYLYIKRHSITGLLYFGFTAEDPEKYLGSGKHWKRHLRKHGKEFVETIWFCLFNDQEELTKFALMCSEYMDIVKSKDANGKKIWANLMVENGRTGRPKGCPGSSGKKNGMYGVKKSPETIALQKKNQPSTAEDKNPRALCWTIISPDGEIFHIVGNLKKFCGDRRLSGSGMWQIADTGIPSTKGKNVGWMAYRHNPASDRTDLRNSVSAK